MRIRLICLFAATALLALGAETAIAQETPVRTLAATEDSTVSQTLRLLTETANHPYLTWPDYPHYQDEMEGLYEPGGYGLIWFESGMPTPQARAAVEALLGSDVHALRPEDYDAGRLQELLVEIAGGRDVDGSELALVDAAISVAFLRFLSDLHIGRVNPENLSFGFNVEDRKLDLAAVVRAASPRRREISLRPFTRRNLRLALRTIAGSSASSAAAESTNTTRFSTVTPSRRRDSRTLPTLTS